MGRAKAKPRAVWRGKNAEYLIVKPCWRDHRAGTRMRASCGHQRRRRHQRKRRPSRNGKRPEAFIAATSGGDSTLTRSGWP